MIARSAKVITAAALAVAVLTWTAHCATAPEAQPAGNELQAAGTFRSAEKGFSIAFPAGWEMKPNPPTIVTALRLAAPGDTFRENVNVVVEVLPKPMTPDEYVDAAIALLKKTFPGTTEVERGKTTLGGVESGYMVYTFKMGAFELKNLAYTVPRDLTCYIITCSATPGTFDKYRPAFEEIAKSFKLETPVPAAPAGLFTSKEKGCSIKFPADWEVTASGLPPTAAVAARRPAAPKDAWLRENVNVVVNDCGRPITADEYNDATWRDAAARLPGFKQIESGKAVIDGADARFVVYSWAPAGAGRELKNLAYVLAKGQRAYVITCTATPETFDKYRPVFEEIANSFTME